MKQGDKVSISAPNRFGHVDVVLEYTLGKGENLVEMIKNGVPSPYNADRLHRATKAYYESLLK